MAFSPEDYHALISPVGALAGMEAYYGIAAAPEIGELAALDVVFQTRKRFEGEGCKGTASQPSRAEGLSLISDIKS